MRTSISSIAALAGAVALAGCASTQVEMFGSVPPTSVCQTGQQQMGALVLWGTQWRPDQKDVAQRDAAAEGGLKRFFAQSGCFARAEVRRVTMDGPMPEAKLNEHIKAAAAKPDRVLLLTVRELGPVVKLMASAALVEGGTEVVLSISPHTPGMPYNAEEYSIKWQNGGPGVIRGTGGLEDDMVAALQAGVQRRGAAK